MATDTARLGRLVLVPTLMLALAACVADPPHASTPAATSASTPAVTSSPAPTDDLSDSTWNSGTASLGGTATTDSGLAVSVSRPARVRPTPQPVGRRSTPVLVAVTVVNGQDEPVDLRQLTLSATSGRSGTACATVQDAAGVVVRTTSVLASGGRARWTAAFSCPGTTGQPLVVAVTPRAGFADLEFTGQLP